MKIEIVPCLHDNYAYILSTGGDAAAVVDASEAAPILSALAGRKLVAILSTHHHYDHCDANAALRARFPHAAVYGHAEELAGGHRIPEQTHGLRDGEGFTLTDLQEAQGQGLHVPGHTTTAVAFYLPAARALFTGDTMFAAGCGRLFEGTPAQMHASLARLMSLPPETRVYCGHEYTVKSLRFAEAVEPDNAAIKARQQVVDELRSAGAPSIPGTLADEAATNPFVRTGEPSVIAAVSRRPAVGKDELDRVEVLARLRAWKDAF